jgi:phage N-6-adenine-methyltransferase
MSNFFEAGKAALTSNNEEWETPQSLFEKLDAIYHFTLDPCSTHLNAKCEKHYTREEDGLSRSWEGETVFCNPPYGRNIGRWVEKCARESKRARVVLLIPARTDTAYFHDFIYHKARIQFLRGRLKFEMGGVAMNTAPFPSMLVYWGCD